MKRIVLSLVLIVSISSLSAVIYECPSMARVREIVNPQEEDESTLGAFDLDNTVMEPAGIWVRNFDPENRYQVGSDQWFTAVLRYFTINSSAYPERRPIQYTMELNQIAQFCIRVKPVEEDMISMINELRERHVPTLGLTARSHPLAEITLRQLCEQVGVRFDLSCINIREMIFESEREQFLPAILKDAVLFCSDNTKGTMLCRFLLEALDSESKYLPKKIICFDDKRHHLEKIEEAITLLNLELAKRAALKREVLVEYARLGVPCPYSLPHSDFTPIEFIGIRYGYLDHKVALYAEDGLFSPISIAFLRERSESPSFTKMSPRAKVPGSPHGLGGFGCEGSVSRRLQ